jgi:hypothetical protein
MKTFSEFISERYYEPNEPLPSGKTPYGKATSSYYRQKGEYSRGGKQSDQTFGRLVRQISRRNNEVSRGADNPEFNLKPDKSGQYSIRSDDPRKGMYIFDRKNKVYMNIKQRPEIAPGNKPVYSVAWDRTDDSNPPQNAGQARRVIRNVTNMWKNQVSQRIPNNSVLQNFPLENEKSNRNTRSNIYRNDGNFGPVNKYGMQYANVGRNPSPRQAAKGAQRITPISAKAGEDIFYNSSPSKSDMEKFNQSREHKWGKVADEPKYFQRRQIAPAKPSRPSVRQATQALQATPRVQAPALPRPSASTIPLSSSRLRLRGRAGLALGAAALGAGALAAALNRPKK